MRMMLSPIQSESGKVILQEAITVPIIAARRGPAAVSTKQQGRAGRNNNLIFTECAT